MGTNFALSGFHCFWSASKLSFNPSLSTCVPATVPVASEVNMLANFVLNTSIGPGPMRMWAPGNLGCEKWMWGEARRVESCSCSHSDVAGCAAIAEVEQVERGRREDCVSGEAAARHSRAVAMLCVVFGRVRRGRRSMSVICGVYPMTSCKRFQHVCYFTFGPEQTMTSPGID